MIYTRHSQSHDRLYAERHTQEPENKPRHIRFKSCYALHYVRKEPFFSKCF